MFKAYLQVPFLPDNSGVGSIISLLMYLSFIVFILFGQKIQLHLMLWEVDGGVKRLEFMKEEAKNLSFKTLMEVGKPKNNPLPELNMLLEQFLITPVDMDPSGIIWKLDHLLDVRDAKFKNDVKRLAPAADETQINNLENLIEASLALNTIYRIIRHYYLLGKKTSSYYLILQLQMLMPLIMQEAEALIGAANAFAKGQPIGDGVGPLVAAKLLRGKEKKKVEKDIVYGEVEIENRRVITLKAEGPGGNVGKPGDAIKTLVEENNGNISMVIMIDAALKFEGEKTGEISEGIGAAIGGIGTERFKIEEEMRKFKVPVHAIIVKESIQEAVVPMKREIAEAVDNVIARVKKLILEETKEGDTVILAGIGNTIGIA